jgi:hypothetical protein
MKRKILISVLFAAMLYCIPLAGHAQPTPPGGDPDVPIDGGLSILLAAGVGYVAKKGYEKRKKNAEEKSKD